MHGLQDEKARARLQVHWAYLSLLAFDLGEWTSDAKRKVCTSLLAGTVILRQYPTLCLNVQRDVLKLTVLVYAEGPKSCSLPL